MHFFKMLKEKKNMPRQSRTLFRLQRRPLESICYCLFAILNNKVLEISLPSKLQTHKDTPEFCSKTIAITNSLMKATKLSFLTVTKNTPTLSKQSASGSPVRIKTNPEGVKNIRKGVWIEFYKTKVFYQLKNTT